MSSEWIHGSGRSGKPRPPYRGKKMKCPACGTEVQVYSGGDLEKHKIFYDKKGKQTYSKTSKWKYCDRKKA